MNCLQLVQGTLTPRKQRRHDDRHGVKSGLNTMFSTDQPVFADSYWSRSTVLTSSPRSPLPLPASRTTRRAADARPVRLNSLPTFLCTK